MVEIHAWDPNVINKAGVTWVDTEDLPHDCGLWQAGKRVLLTEDESQLQVDAIFLKIDFHTAYFFIDTSTIMKRDERLI